MTNQRQRMRVGIIGDDRINNGLGLRDKLLRRSLDHGHLGRELLRMSPVANIVEACNKIARARQISCNGLHLFLGLSCYLDFSFCLGVNLLESWSLDCEFDVSHFWRNSCGHEMGHWIFIPVFFQWCQQWFLVVKSHVRINVFNAPLQRGSDRTCIFQFLGRHYNPNTNDVW